MNTYTRTRCAAAVVCGLTLAAKADTISYTASTSGTFDFPATALALPQFNPSLGTLDSITISISSSTDTALSVYNNSPSTYGSANVWNDVQICLGNSAFDQAVAALNPNAPTGFVLPNAWLDVTSPKFNVTGLASGDTADFNANNTPASGRAVTTADITSGTIFTALQGTGTQALDVYSDSTVDSGISGGATFQANETVTGDISATVTYNYSEAEPVPEPSTISLVGIGLGSLIPLLRRRSA